MLRRVLFSYTTTQVHLYFFYKREDSYMKLLLSFFLFANFLILPLFAETIVNIEKVAAALERDTPVKIDQRIYARILSGLQAQDFLTMTRNVSRKIVFYLDASGLEKMVGISDREKLILIGYPADYIERKLQEGFQYKMVIFKDDTVTKIATWDNIEKLMTEIYSGQLALYQDVKNLEMVEKVQRNLPLLKEIYKDVESAKIKAAQAYQKIQEMGGELWEVRSFLHENLKLNENFSGDGYTRLDNGEKGIAEYISPNIEIKKLKQSVIIDLNLTAKASESY